MNTRKFTLTFTGLILAGSALSSISMAGPIPGSKNARLAVPNEQHNPTRQAYTVSGFRSAKFGMKRDAVIAAAHADFAVSESATTSGKNNADGTSVLVVPLTKLEPGVGPATITYIFGKDSQELVHVNVVWLIEGNASPEQRDAISIAAVSLVNHLRSYSWESNRSVQGIPVGTNSVVAFVGKDKSGAAVEVRLDGVAYSKIVNGKPKTSAAPKGAARLRIAYSRNPGKPDIAVIAKGQF